MAIIRSAQPPDSEALLQLARDFSTSFKVQDASFRESLRKILSSPQACLLVAEENGNVIGYLLGFEHPTFYANGNVAWVEEITVSPALRRNGIGRMLMDKFEEWASNKNAKLVALATRRAADFYKAIGYEESATYFRKLV